MKNEDVVLLHRLWLNVTREPGLENIHHHDILTEALTRFARDYGARDRGDILKELRRLNAADTAQETSSTSNPAPSPVVRKESDDGPPPDRPS